MKITPLLLRPSAALILIFSFTLLACNNSTEENQSNPEEDLTLETTVAFETPVDQNSPGNINLDLTNVDKMDYQEFYESGILKIEGNFDANEERQGIWASYYETGVKWSESHYVHGIKNGHSIAFFPNSKVRYMGEYQGDKKIGLWRFYDEAGTLVTEENYD